nr:hypothetical protein [uncultured Gemmiger sp.]
MEETEARFICFAFLRPAASFLRQGAFAWQQNKPPDSCGNRLSYFDGPQRPGGIFYANQEPYP